MKGQKVKGQATGQADGVLVININLTRGMGVLVVAGLVLVAFLGYLVWGQGEVAASAPQAPRAAYAGMRQYYLTTSATYDGDGADGTDGNGAGVCASGYHFASMWELLDPSNLGYNTVLGYTTADSGQGPPSSDVAWGWVRTGNVSSTFDPVGTGNCENWTVTNSFSYGAQAKFDSSWSSAGDFPGWVVENRAGGCAVLSRVWCVED